MGGVVAEIDYPVGVPLVAEDEDRDEGDRCEHRRRAQPSRGIEDRDRGGGDGEEDSSPREDAAQSAPFATRLQAMAAERRWIVPGGTRTRS